MSGLQRCRKSELQNDIYLYLIAFPLSLSTGAETGDYSLVETGDLPSPLDKLREQAHSDGHYCAKFFRLTTDGITICEDHRINMIVATTGKIYPGSTVRIYNILDTYTYYKLTIYLFVAAFARYILAIRPPRHFCHDVHKTNYESNYR